VTTLHAEIKATTGLSIGEAAEASGVSAHTLRYYERAGLMRPIEREGNGHRLYSDDDLGWIEVLTKLRKTGMPIRRMRRYAELVFAGDGTERERLALLEAHRDDVRRELAELQQCLAFVEFKVEKYKEKLQ
jgi:DNA-binding transcriptional MerR regulator